MTYVRNGVVFLIALTCSACAYGQLATTLSVETTLEPDGRTRYEYLLENLPESTFPVNVLLLDVGPGADPQSILGPTGWQSDFSPDEPNYRLGWGSAGPQFEIAAGSSGVFSFTSPLGPGDMEFVVGNLLPDGSDFADVLFGSVAGPTVPPAGISGDYNGNGRVEQADLDLVLLNWGQALAQPWVDGTVDQAELDGVLLNWGNEAALGGAAGVPEPTARLLAFLSAMGLAARYACRLIPAF
jgi:hypothetical protein